MTGTYKFLDNFQILLKKDKKKVHATPAEVAAATHASGVVMEIAVPELAAKLALATAVPHITVAGGSRSALGQGAQSPCSLVFISAYQLVIQ
jgi:hypothetical protein